MIVVRGGSAGQTLWSGAAAFGGQVRLSLDGVNGAPAIGVVEVRSTVTIQGFDAVDAKTLAPRPLPPSFLERMNRARPGATPDALPEPEIGFVVVTAGSVASGWLPEVGGGGGVGVWLDANGVVIEPPLPVEVERVEWSGNLSRVVRATVPTRSPDLLVRARVAHSMSVLARSDCSDLALRLV